MLEYHKIQTLFERDPKTKKLIKGKFCNLTVEYLKNNVWTFTEKVDGTNIRVYWDGHNVHFGGRNAGGRRLRRRVCVVCLAERIYGDNRGAVDIGL